MEPTLKNLKLVYGTGDDVSFIIRYFEDFYREIIRFKNEALGDQLPPSNLDQEEEGKSAPETNEPVKPEIKTDQTPESPIQPASHASLPEEILLSLKNLLKRQAIDAARFGGEFAAKYYHEAEFIMVALADEVFLHTDWKGKGYWQKNILESQIYDTHSAGETFFDKLEDFLKVRDPSRADIAMVYLLALGLGFKGKYRDNDAKNRLAHYRRELFIFIYHRDPTLFQLATQLIPKSYQHTVETGKVLYLYDFKPLMKLFTGIVFLVFLISYGVWYSTTHEVSVLVDQILSSGPSTI
ncbi:MAG: DotU family type IV/VI secretion system protein [Pseudomonadota bacterium]